MPEVYVIKNGTPSEMAYKAISEVFTEKAEGLSILLKVNTGFNAPAASGVCTHPEVVRGLIRFFKDKNAGIIYVGDSSIVGTDSITALKSAGIWRVCEEEGVKCVNLDDSGMQEQQIPDYVMIKSLKMSKLPFEVDRVISVPVMKTHMFAGVTLGIKNMKGCLFQRDKTRLHRIKEAPPDIKKGKCLDYGIMDLMKVIYPDYCVLDAVVAMEGFGPSGGTPVDMNMVLASKDTLSLDITAVQLMGMAADAVPHINLVREQRGLALEDIHVIPEDYMKWSKQFKLANEFDLHASYSNPTIIEKGACSACHAAMLQFFRYHHQEYTDGPEATLIMGPDSTDEDCSAAKGRCIIVGNCTAKLRKDGRAWCKGCPPVPSQIARTINANETLDD